MRDPSFWWRAPRPRSRLLAPLGALYGVIAARRLMQAGESARVPVICIGNLTVGGAGKTPTAIAVARLLQAAGVGDEPLLLARVAPTIVARDRAAGARAAEAAGAELIVMDDGFQNPALAKDLSLIVVDGRRGLGNGKVFPAGPLRAPLRPQIARAQALLVVGEPGPAAQPAIDGARARGLPVFTGRLVPDPAVAALARRATALPVALSFDDAGSIGRLLAAVRAA